MYHFSPETVQGYSTLQRTRRETAAMGGLDPLVFTAGASENSATIRAKTCEDMGWMGLELDQAKNSDVSGGEVVISRTDSKVQVMVIPTNEELVIARETAKIVESLPKAEPESAGQPE